MEQDRERLGYQLTDAQGCLASDLYSHLCGQKFDPENQYFEILLKNSPTPSDIQKLVRLPYEIAITEDADRLILSTGMKNYAGKFEEEGYQRRRFKSKVSFHTHPSYGPVSMTVPSLSDAFSTSVGPKTVLSLAHEQGLTIYQEPQINPFNNNPIGSESVTWLITNWGRLHRTTITGFEKKLDGRRFKSWDTLPIREQVRLTREFYERCDMIVDEASWEDEDGIERVLTKALNGVYS